MVSNPKRPGYNKNQARLSAHRASGGAYMISMMVSAVIFTVLGYRILKELERIR